MSLCFVSLSGRSRDYSFNLLLRFVVVAATLTSFAFVSLCGEVVFPVDEVVFVAAIFVVDFVDKEVCEITSLAHSDFCSFVSVVCCVGYQKRNNCYTVTLPLYVTCLLLRCFCVRFVCMFITRVHAELQLTSRTFCIY